MSDAFFRAASIGATVVRDPCGPEYCAEAPRRLWPVTNDAKRNSIWRVGAGAPGPFHVEVSHADERTPQNR